MNVINTLNILNSNLISMVILAMVLANIYFFNKRVQRSMRYFILLIFSVFFLLILDSIAWIVLGDSGEAARIILFVSKYLFLLFNTVPSTLWALYLLNGFGEKEPNRRVHLAVFSTTILYWIFFIAVSDKGIVFYIDDKNFFHRNWGIYVTMTVVYINIFFVSAYAFFRRKQINTSTLKIIVIISVIPVAGGAIQMIFYGLSTTWPFTTLGVLMVYVFLEIQKQVNDYLTGLMNRRKFEELVQYRIEKKTPDRGFTLILMDMNDFKSINDNYGHHTGDRALQEAANLIARSVGINDKTGRLGGDEFLILLDSNDRAVIERVVSRLRSNFNRWNEESESPYTLSLSLGWAVFDRSIHGNFSSLLREADFMMYRDKRESKRSDLA